MIEIGEKLSGRYKITGHIGNGGMANVFLAHDLILDRDVAIKVLRFDFQEDQSAIRRFQREALAVTELVHPNIVNVYDVDEENGMQFIVMEYVKGPDRNLKEYIQNHYPIPLTKVIDIMEQILSAVSLAHRQGIIHRDLKPQNILMDERGTVKIADFGIAIALSETSITQTNTLLGSVHYLSPEQARGGMATRQSDIYALGIILYELLTGNVPFEGESAVSIALKHFQEELPSVRLFNPQIPQALENIVLHATAKEAVDRYASADEMAADLSTALSPSRIGEPPFEPQAMVEETKVITPVKHETDSPSSEPESEPVKAVETPAASKPTNELPAAKQKKAASRKKKILAIGAGVLLLLGLLLFFFLRSAPKDVVIPDVSGKTVDEASQILEDANLKVAFKKEKMVSDEYEEGQVVKTMPAIGETVRENASITLYVSSGQEKVSLADYQGKDYDAVQKELLGMGFSAERIERENKTSDEVEAGKIIKQSPAAGKQVDPKTDTIKLTVSSGTETVNVPSFIGWTRGNVQDYLEKKGLVLSALEDYSDETAAGLAIQQSIVNQEVEKGTTITVTFSKGPQPTISSSTVPSSTSTSSSDTPTEAFNVNVSVSYRGDGSGDEENIRIEVQDKNHPSWTPVSEFRLGPNATMESKTVSLAVDKNETAAIRVFSNDKNIYESNVTSKTTSIEVK